MPFRLLSRRARFLATAVAVSLIGAPLTSFADEAALPAPGAYLAAGVALSEFAFVPAAQYLDAALLADPTNPALLDRAIVANIGLGDIDKAAGMADRLLAAGGKSQAANLALVARAAKSGDFESILATKADAGSVAMLDDLVKAWALVGLGRMSDATAAFDKIAATNGLEAFGLYHKALALASAGDFEGADKILSADGKGGVALSRRGVIAQIQILSQLERNEEAIALIDRTFAPGSDVEVDDLRRRLAAGEPIPYDVARNATEGIAEVFYSLAVAVNGQTEDTFTLLHSRTAVYLRPDYIEAILLTAGLLQGLNQDDLAAAAFAEVPADSPQFYIAEIGRANTTYASGDKEGGLNILRNLAKTHGQILAVQIALGDGLRREGQFAEAKLAYDAAIAMVTEPGPEHWVLYFSRGVSEERSGDFAAAEVDLREALKLDPKNPQVLNYLGYSLVDRGVNLDEALGMIQLAVAGQPDSGEILDSLAWAYYRLGRYQDALGPQEQASLMEPVEPVVTDHLGDVYWAVGRKREAQFQWRRALSFNPDEVDAVRIRAKLEKGLDVVLQEEGAPPLHPADAASE